LSKIEYSEAPEVESIAEDLISKYHQHIIDYDVRIRYVFINKTPTSKGKEIWGTCRKISGLNAYLESNEQINEPFFVITISKNIWDILPKDKKIALVDHELCHASASIKKDDSISLEIQPHDLEEFSCIVRRHGLWREDIQEFVNVANQTKNKGEN